MDLVDVHSHILPGVDDGSGSVEETIAMLSLAYESGTRRIVATPHMFLHRFGNYDFVQIRDQFDQLSTQLESAREEFAFLGQMQIFCGAENYASSEFLEALEQGCVLTLNASRYLLVEVSPALPFSQLENVMDRVLGSGLTPVMAHPERYSAVQEQPIRLAALWDRGCVTQLNGGSLLRGSGSRTNRCAKTLLAEGLVDVIASDGHRVGWRPPELGGVEQLLEGEYSQEDIRRWLMENPAVILANGTLEVADEPPD